MIETTELQPLASTAARLILGAVGVIPKTYARATDLRTVGS